MDQPLRLVDDPLNDGRMAVAGGSDGDPGCEVKVSVAIHILYEGALALFYDQWVGTGIGLGDDRLVASDPFCGIRAGGNNPNLWLLRMRHITIHLKIP